MQSTARHTAPRDLVKTVEREASRRSEPEGSRVMLCLLAAASFTIFSSAATTGAPITTATYHPPEPAGSGSSGEESAAALYSWNNNNSNPDCCGGLIVEGCAQYPGGPTCWGSPPNATVPSGSYGWIVLGFKANHTADCPAIPADGIGSVLGKDTPLYPVSLKEALNQDGQPLCALACNISEVERTGIDPCNKGTIAAHAPLPAWLLPPVQKTGSPEQLPGPVNMSCYWGGMVCASSIFSSFIFRYVVVLLDADHLSDPLATRFF